MAFTQEQQARADQIKADILAMSTRTNSQSLTLRKDGHFKVKGETFRRVDCTIRWDDHCKNGYNSMGITGSAWLAGKMMKESDPDTCGCIHEILMKVFPEVTPLIRFHLIGLGSIFSHAVGNAIYHAGDRDCWGRRAGEPSSWDHFFVFDDCPITMSAESDGFRAWVLTWHDKPVDQWPSLAVVPVTHKSEGRDYTRYTFEGYPLPPYDWHKAPFNSESKAREFAAAAKRWGVVVAKIPSDYSKGKAPDLDAARSCAAWPDATLEQLQDVDGLIERVPALVADMRAELEKFAKAKDWAFTF